MLRLALLLIALAGTEATAAPLPGLAGMAGYDIVTANPAAQFHFDRGLALYLTGDMQAAEAWFREAILRDRTCVLCWWAIALTARPGQRQRALEALATARNMPPATPKEAAMVETLVLRFSTPDAYPAAAAALAERYPDDPLLGFLAEMATRQLGR